MKKTAAVMLTLALLLSLCACTKPGDDNSRQFAARIGAAKENSLTVTPDVTSREYKIADTIVVAVTENTALEDSSGTRIDMSFFTAGTEVMIGYDGTVEESYPAKLTAKYVRLRNGVVSGTASPVKGDTITFTVEGQSETVDADKVALKNCHILVPSEGWVSRSADDTQVGPILITVKDNSGVALTFRIHVNESAEGVKAMLAKQHPGFSWQGWSTNDKSAGFSAAVTADGVHTAAFVEQMGADTVSILCRCPQEMEEGYGARLAQIAATLTADK